MNISRTHLQKPSAATLPARSEQPVEDSSFFMNFDPFSGIKDGFRTAGEETGEFIMGAVPGLGIHSHFGDMVFGGSSDHGTARAGFFLNAAGTAGLAVSAGMAAFGADPTIALGVSALALGTSGVLYASNN